MKPYFQDDAVTIYHGDCREILPQLGKVDLVLTDPPYKVSGKRGVISKEKSYKSLNEDWDYDFEVAWLDSLNDNMLVFCSYHLLKDYLNWKTPRQILHWHKINAFPSLCDYYDWSIEYILWYSSNSPIFNRDFAKHDLFETGICSGNERLSHATQKPLKLIEQLILVHSNKADTILDPFMGSGTTLRAAKNLGRKAIGIEIEEKYCEIAARRMAQQVMNLEV